MSDPKPEARFPDKLQCLFQPARYKILFGGRGGAKSWGVARALLILGASRPIRVLCAREIQKSMKDSVHKLLSDQIAALGLAGFYQVLDKEIRGQNGTEFMFDGLRHNIDNIKSKEGVDYCWVEEAQTVSAVSWSKLIPTIRKEGSEIWVTFNPDLDTDETYKRFVKDPPQGAVVVKVNWSDNPWFPDVLRAEMEALKERDYDAYLTVWEGHCKHTLDGAIYAAELRKATQEGRITKVQYNSLKPVHTFWDLGWSDSVSIWFAQTVGLEFRVIDFHQDRQKKVSDYLQVLQSKGYVYGADWLPHDAQAETLAADGRSIEQMMKGAGRTVKIVPKLGKTDGINAAREIFGNCWFDETKCADGLNALRRYRYEVDPESGQWKRTPLHDENSHAADAFRYLAVALREAGEAKKLKLGKKPNLNLAGAGGWMR